jgi:hypothetical protein
MEDAIRRCVERMFPELSGGYHLPRFARIVGVADAPTGAAICDDFRPRFAVDLEVLDETGEPDTSMPTLAGVPLPVPSAGNEMGFFSFPEEGTSVVVAFAQGLPHKPFIQCILPHGLSLPRLPKGDQVWQHSEAAQQRVEADGSWTRQTDGGISDKSTDRLVESLTNAERYQSDSRIVDDHSTESVGGIKTIEALGALKLLSGGTLNAASVDDLNLSTGRDLNQVVGQKLNLAVGGDLLERIQGLHKAVAEKVWLGSEGVNVLQVLCDLIDLVQALATQLSTHTHVPGPAPSSGDAGQFTAKAAQAALLAAQLKPITE